MATVDVIIPSFNAAKYLPAALESVFSQTFDDWRILLVDDGSTDNTAEVVAPFLDRFGPRIKYIKQNNRGLPAARNAAIQASTAEFLALLDADDLWLPCRLSESLKVLAERPQAGLALVRRRVGLRRQDRLLGGRRRRRWCRPRPCGRVVVSSEIHAPQCLLAAQPPRLAGQCRLRAALATCA